MGLGEAYCVTSHPSPSPGQARDHKGPAHLPFGTNLTFWFRGLDQHLLPPHRVILSCDKLKQDATTHVLTFPAEISYGVFGENIERDESGGSNPQQGLFFRPRNAVCQVDHWTTAARRQYLNIAITVQCASVLCIYLERYRE